MSKIVRAIFVVVVSLCILVVTASAQAPPCPGYDPNHNVNLACQIPTTIRTSTSGSQTLGQLSPTIAAQLSQLPLTTAVTGSGLTLGKSLVPTISTDSLGTTLTQRGETLGYHKFYAAFSYQRFTFDSIDGISLHQLDTVNQAKSGSTTIFVAAHNRVDLLVDQLNVIGSFGLSARTDVSLLVPFAKVTLKTQSFGTQFDSIGTPPTTFPVSFFPGSATGLGDIAVNVKRNVFKSKSEQTNIALGGEVRFPTGDETNFLGTGAYGVKPYFVFSSHHGRITPNVNLGYQWNSSSALFINSTTGKQLNLPSAFLYSGGVDISVVKRLTLNAAFLGQCVFDGPRLIKDSVDIPGQGKASTVTPNSSTYGIDNFGVGFKANPFKGLLISGNVMFKLDDGGLRSTVVPLGGISYRF